MRIQRTRALLHEALGSLMRDKTYDRITVADVLHEHLRHVLSEWIAKIMDEDSQRRRSGRAPVAAELLAQHIASAFVLVLHWWLDHNGSATPAEADRLFRALIMPVLGSAPA